MRSKLAYQYGRPNAEHMRQANAIGAKFLFLPGEVPDRNSFQELKNEQGGFWTGRVVLPIELQKLCLTNPLTGAKKVFEMMSPTMDALDGIIDAWEFINEEGHHNPEIKNFVKSTLRFIELMHAVGRKVVAGNWGSGNPDRNPDKLQNLPRYEEDPGDFMKRLKAHWDLYLPILEATDYLDLHQYAWETIQTNEPFWVGRHTLDWQVWPPHIQAREDWIIIGEFGIDHGMIGDGLMGWKATGMSEDTFRDQCAKADKEYFIPWRPIKIVYFFIAFPLGEDWNTFRMEDTPLVSDYIRNSDFTDFISMPPIQPEEPREEKPMPEPSKKLAVLAWINASDSDQYTIERFIDTNDPLRPAMKAAFEKHVHDVHNSDDVHEYGWFDDVDPSQANLAGVTNEMAEIRQKLQVMAAAAPFRDYVRQLALETADRVGIPREMFGRQISQESGFNFLIYNPGSTAAGAGQIIQRWHPGVRNPFDPKEALEYSAQLMKGYFERWGDWAKALACYNWGSGHVADAASRFGTSWRQALPEETTRYIRNILQEAA